MSRRSSRLASGAHYHSDEESDSSNMTNISYRENPVKVFKKKAGTRKGHTRTLTRANSNASSESPKTSITADQDDGVSPSPSRSQTPPTTKTVTYVPAVATPRPALTLSSARSQTPSRLPSVPPGKSLHSGPCSAYRPGSLLASQHQELGQCGVDSSGYSSSEGPRGRPSTSGIRGSSGAPGARHGGGTSSSFSSLMAKSSFSGNKTKACGVLLLLLLLLMLILSVWLLLPSPTSPVSVTKAPQTKPPTPPATPAIPPPPHSSATRPIPVADPAVVAAAVEAQMRRLTEQLQLEQEQLLSEMSERFQLRLRDMEARLEALDLDARLRLEQELTRLGKRLADYQTESRSAAADLGLRIRAVEAQNAQLSEEWSSFRVTPLPVPCLDTSPAHNQLTPELQQAMEKWFAERVKVQDAVRLAGKGSCSDCGRPMADKMADFALETQGASVISTRCSETYRSRSACVTLFGFPLWYPSESPRTVIQGFPVLLPGKCWAFHGVQGTLVISLSHPIRISHVTLDHLPRYSSPTGRIDSAPRDFEVYGMKNDTEEGALLGRFTYDEGGESTQTFELPTPSDAAHRLVELRVLTNWGHVEYTCLYRFRVHGQIPST